MWSFDVLIFLLYTEFFFFFLWVVNLLLTLHCCIFWWCSIYMEHMALFLLTKQQYTDARCGSVCHCYTKTDSLQMLLDSVFVSDRDVAQHVMQVLSVSSRRDNLVGFHKGLPTSPSVDDDASCCVRSLLPSDNSGGRRYDIVESASADSAVCWGLCVCMA